MNKPNLFLIGAPKCGTTALAINLSQHKDIFLPKQKEPRYFDRETFYDDKNDYITKNIDEYLEYYFEAQKEKYLLDGSVFNMYSEKSIEDILKFSPNAKFIIIIRDPVEASISMFHQRLSYVDPAMREICEDFNKCWALLKKRSNNNGYPKGCKNKFLFRYDLLYSYQNYLPYLKERLGDKLFIGFYNEYKNNPEVFFKKLFDFLEIEHIKINNKEINKSNILKKSFFLSSLNFIAKYTLKLRKKLGLTGLINIKKYILLYYGVPARKDIEVDEKVYKFFKPTYIYLKELKNELNNKNPK